ncbi:hypothetical protein [Nostoc sp.]
MPYTSRANTLKVVFKAIRRVGVARRRHRSQGRSAIAFFIARCVIRRRN